MNNNGWLDISSCPSAATAEDDRHIIVWHVYQGVMVTTIRQAKENHFHVYWQEIPNNWIATAAQTPTALDADALSCVIFKDRHGGVRMKGWHQITAGRDTEYWETCPDPPGNASELRRNAN